MLMRIWFRLVRLGSLMGLENNAADEAADLGYWRVGFAVIDARRNLSGVSGGWYPVTVLLHRFFVAITLHVASGDQS